MSGPPSSPSRDRCPPFVEKKLHFVVTVFAYTNISPKPYSVPIPPTPLETFDSALAGINSQQTPVIPTPPFFVSPNSPNPPNPFVFVFWAIRLELLVSNYVGTTS